MALRGSLAAASCWLLGGLPLPAGAQVEPPPAIDRAAALACISPPSAERGQPEYPPALLQRKSGDTVKVELSFDAPDAPPGFRVLDREKVSPLLVDSVRRHVRQLRMPCLPKGAAPVIVAQAYRFSPYDQRAAFYLSTTKLSAEEGDPRRFECVRHVSGEDKPHYPLSAEHAGQQGTVAIEMRFTVRDGPPQVRVIVASRHSASFVAAVTSYVSGYRLPCLEDRPVVAQQTFRFGMSDSERAVLRDTDLLTFMRSAAELPRPARFDLNQMGCPFDVRLHYRQPFQANTIAELDNTRPERRPFLEWLTKVRLKLDESTSASVYDDTMEVAVPCTRIEL